ncbi:MAG: GNAT family N-acetyltransferase [Minisyncoccia bacterium]
MNEIITKRPAEKNDFEFAKNVHHLAYHDVVLKQFGSWDEKMQDGFFERSWIPETHQIIYFNNVPAGYCSFINYPDHIFASELVILPEFQGKGIGSKLLTNLIKESDEKSIPIKLQVFKQNRAQELYRRLGYKDVEEEGTHIKMEYVPSK